MPVQNDPPPTHLVRAFIELVRCRSFRGTADAVGLTQSAVSQRIASLEGRIGLRLYDRELNAPTDAGLAYSTEMAPLLSAMAAAEGRIARRSLPKERRALRISATSSFARCCLIPRLPGMVAHLGISLISLHVSDTLVSLEDDDFDIAIRVRPDTIREGTPLGEGPDDLVAIAPPSFEPADARCPLLHIEMLEDDCSGLGLAPRESWNEWHRSNGLERMGREPNMVLNDSGLIVDAVKAGYGAGLVRRSLVQADLGAGRLRRIGAAIPSASQTRLLQRRDGHPLTGLAAEWVLENARKAA